ncbi:hypothetical protein ACFE04_018890 [Oxalis oulophora]
MASSTTVYRNGTSKGLVKTITTANSSSNLKTTSFKSRHPPQPSGSVLRRCSTGSFSAVGGDGVPGRVRVAVRLRPRNQEELVSDADFADCVELQPELKRLKLRKNNWDSDTYEFDEVLTEYASQKRVYEVVAKPVVESVLSGYNGTVMAYGQTGTGKTFTLGQLGEEDTSSRGIMVRSMEDILAEISPDTDSLSVSYLQLYMETIQDLLDPVNDNISIVEDPKTGDVSLPGATIVDIRNQQDFMELLKLGETHRIAANTKLNTESSRSHALLMINVKRSSAGKEDTYLSEAGTPSPLVKPLKPLVRKSKLVLVDLAGSERVQKSGSEGHMLEEAKFINLSLSALGKCINALAENSAHVPVRDSKLTRLLKDSFGGENSWLAASISLCETKAIKGFFNSQTGVDKLACANSGTARTSLIVTIGPSPRHRGETASTILFGQRAMKVENMLKIKEEFDYKSLSRKLEIQVDKLIAENERQQKDFNDEVERIHVVAQSRISEVEQNFADALEKERLNCQMEYMDSIKQLEEKMMVSSHRNGFHDDKYNGEAPGISSAEEISELKRLLENEVQLRKTSENEVNKLKNELAQFTQSGAGRDSEISKLQEILEDETSKKRKLEEEVMILQNQLLQLNFEVDQLRKCLDKGGSGNNVSGLDSLMSQIRQPQYGESTNGQKAPVPSLFEQVGLQKILSFLDSEDPNVRIHAVKVVANLAAEEANQERIVEAGGLSSLLMLLRSYEDETVRRVAAGAIANLAMNEINQELIMVEGGISLLSITAADADDPQTLRMVAGALANLCGNDKLQPKLRSEGGIKALLGMVRCGHCDVLSQIARGIANFAKCESRACIKNGRSVLIDDGALPWIVKNANNEAAPIRRHIELALCHLAQHEVNARDMIRGGALWELVRISQDCSREDIRSLAHRTLQSSPTFRNELRRLRIDI